MSNIVQPPSSPVPKNSPEAHEFPVESASKGGGEVNKVAMDDDHVTMDNKGTLEEGEKTTDVSSAVHLSPDRDDATGANGSFVDLGSPTPSSSNPKASSSMSSPYGTPESSSSYDLIGTSPESPALATSRATQTTTTQATEKESSKTSEPQSTFHHDLVSFPPRKKVTLSAPHPDSPSSPTTNRSRTWSSSTSPENLGSSLSPKDSVQSSSNLTTDRRDRSLHAGTSLRGDASLSPVLSPIPDVAPSTVLNPSAHTFELTDDKEMEEVELFPLGSTFKFIVKHGKNEVGDLTPVARNALAKLGLKPIPSMQGPLSLPYARCPSGIDAFLFSMDKQEDPWTFVLHPDRPRRIPSARNPRIPLPGNARYSQAIQKGFLPNRVVSAPAAFQDHSGNSRMPHPVSTPPDAITSVQQILESSRPSLATTAPIPEPPTPVGAEWSYGAGIDPFASGSTVPLAQSPYWANPYMFPPSFYPQYSVPFSAPGYYHPQNAPPPNVDGILAPMPYDPAILSYGQQRPDPAGYYSEDEIEPHLGGFFFPLSEPPHDYNNDSSRRTSTTSAGTSVPILRKTPSTPQPTVSFADRRNSMIQIPTSAGRKSSLVPPVTVSPPRRRQSVAAATRLVRDPLPPSPPAPTLVPHHGRPGSLSNVASSTTIKTVGGRRFTTTSRDRILGDSNTMWREPQTAVPPHPTPLQPQAQHYTTSPNISRNGQENQGQSSATHQFLSEKNAFRGRARGRFRATRGRGGSTSQAFASRSSQ